MRDVKRLLFVCVENANRSQMAEAFARILGGEAVEAWSAGSRRRSLLGATTPYRMSRMPPFWSVSVVVLAR